MVSPQNGDTLGGPAPPAPLLATPQLSYKISKWRSLFLKTTIFELFLKT